MAKIGIDARFYSSTFTGIGRYSAELIKHLAVLDQENEYVIFLNEPQYSSFKVPNERFKKVCANAAHYSIAEQTRFAWLIKNENLDLMHFTHFNAPLLYQGKSVVTIHDLTLEMYPGKKMTNLISRIGYRLTIKNISKKSKHIFTVSQHTKGDLMRILGIDPEKITVTYNGIGPEFKPSKNEELIKKVRDEYNLNKPFILYTGVWRTHKNLRRLIYAFQKLRDEKGLDILLVLTGKPDSIYNEIPETIKSLNLDDFVRRVGLVPEEELPVLYSIASAYAFPSLYEGFGLPPLEAMACGTPVAASLASSIPEVCGEENALFFDPLNTEEIAEKLALIIQNQELSEKLAKKGLNQVKKFSWEETAKKTFESYCKVLN